MDMRRRVPCACLIKPDMNFVLSFGMAPARAHNRLGTGTGLMAKSRLICQLLKPNFPVRMERHNDKTK
jgi:hypothetical protein